MVCIRLFWALVSERSYQRNIGYKGFYMFASLILKVRKASSDSNQRVCNPGAHFCILILTESLSGQLGRYSQDLSLLRLQKNALKLVCKEITFPSLLCFLFSQKAQLHIFWTQHERDTTRKMFQSKNVNYLLCTAFLFPLKGPILGMLVACLQIEWDLILSIS